MAYFSDRAELQEPCVFVLLGVAGSGKSTCAEALSRRLGCSFADADAFHPIVNVEKMSRGEPLDDADRRPWLLALTRHIGTSLARGTRSVLACSALKASYRQALVEHVDSKQTSRVAFIHLHAPQSVIADRISQRGPHFFTPALLASQYAALEPVDYAREGIVGFDIDVSASSVGDVVEAIIGTYHVDDDS